MAYHGGSDGASSLLSSAPSDPSSPLTVLSSSPSPPPEFALFAPLPTYPSPSSSQRSSANASPAPENMASTPPSSNDSGGPPRKKRKLADPKPRTTEQLDLRAEEVAESERPQLERLLKVLHKKRKIVVIAGAGISVSAGIPDFRSSGGLFSSLRKQHKLKSSGKDLFDASVYQDDSSTSSFHDMVRSLSQKTKDAQPTAFHHLLATLAHEGRLLRLYSQNVDGIDTSLPPLKTEVPLPKKGPWPKTVQLHGGLDHMVCSKCHTLSDFDADQFNGPVPPACSNCALNDAVRQVAEKRSHGIGRLRPRMVLYNEHNPDDEAIGSCASLDLRTRPDAVIVAGTTLKVPGVRRIAREMCGVVRGRRDGVTVWINNDPEPMGKDLQNCWDLVVRGPCDEVARHAAMRRWDDPIIYREVTDEQLTKAKVKQKAEVVVSSPRKPQALEQIQRQLVTPAPSPRIAPQQPMKQEPAEQPTTPSKTKGKKRKSQGVPAENSADNKTKRPAPKKQQARAKKQANAKSNAKPNNSRITDAFRTSKTVLAPSLKSKGHRFIPSEYIGGIPNQPTANEDSKDNINVAPKPAPSTPAPKQNRARVTVFKKNSNNRHMASISSSDPRYNTAFPLTPDRPAVEPFTSPVSSPYPFSLRRQPQPESMLNDSRPSSSSSHKSDTIIPEGPLPHNFGVLLDMATG
ncbi:DHS-like NAD/FAD-binding domain-containing protein [Lindgomyces ingoldianus]|uniref:DHS-like NAD/FAD-binding domain-containing protein n=1 Tax=Lindgomyces ingoldianus TaxID=673940 RepID=A0ACB6QY50_9PLEO|nr:DHS-like NAD/FAD-binding domain-containing protein [Lindgomyces ingoldianus]KAF2471914.1 DHS-like NAD/FAD-binding domain-containing protein [Lindgomyces ingoldianus]